MLAKNIIFQAFQISSSYPTSVTMHVGIPTTHAYTHRGGTGPSTMASPARGSIAGSAPRGLLLLRGRPAAWAWTRSETVKVILLGRSLER